MPRAQIAYVIPTQIDSKNEKVKNFYKRGRTLEKLGEKIRTGREIEASLT